MVAKGILGASTKIVFLSVCRFLQTTEVNLFRVNDGIHLRRVGQRLSHPLRHRRLVKDSEIVEMENEDYGDDGRPYEDFLEQTYREEKRKFMRSKPHIKYRSKKDTIGKRVKEPNMLTTNERQHMIFLHESDPVEWDARALSESFPALPWMIEKILKQKWNPDNKEKMKQKDELVLKNWGKLKENELEASPEFLEHLKKFVDRRENLEVQLKNPNFFHLPEVKKETPWVCDGPMKSMLVKYEKQLEQLKKIDESVKSLPQQSNKNETTALVETTQARPGNDNEIVHRMDYLLPDSEMAEDTRFRGRRTRKPVTLEVLKKKVFDKSEVKEDLISPSEEQLIQKTLRKNSLDESPNLGSTSRQETLVPQEKEPKHPEYNSKYSRRVKEKAEHLKSIEQDTMDSANVFGDYANAFDSKELGNILYKDNKKQIETATPKVDETKVQKKKTVNTVNYFNTEKDKVVYGQYEELLGGTEFWNKKSRTRSLDAGLFGAQTHADTLQLLENYQAYDYPEKIEIPKDKRVKGKLYKVKDCYYDDDGKFLYRVPGMID